MNLRNMICSAPEWIASRLSKKAYERKYAVPQAPIPSSASLDDIINFLGKAGITDGSTLFIHSSWKHLASGNFSAPALINTLISLLGSGGTLAMPAYAPYSWQRTGVVFDVRRTPSGAGLLSDAFRRYPGVWRSINLNHSVCARGANAAFLTSEHHRSETSWDCFSPYYRLREIDDAWIVGLGVGRRLKVATSLHCVESMLWKHNAYFRKLFREKICYKYKTISGDTGQHCYMKRSGQIYTPKLAKFFTSDELIEDCIEGLEVYAIRARTLIDKAIALGEEGKTMYVWPIPWSRYFKS